VRKIVASATCLAIAACGGADPLPAAPVAAAAAPATPAPVVTAFSDPTAAIAGQAQAMTKADMVEAIPINSGAQVTQAFETCVPINGIKVTVVTWNQAPVQYPLNWSVKSSTGAEISAGIFDASKLADWQAINMPAVAPAGSYVLTISAASGPPVERAVGIVLSEPATNATPPASSGKDGLVMSGALQSWMFADTPVGCP
jgi:hypothetical protein